MVSDELIANSRQNMLDTLADFSCVDRQRKYAAAVPYVHVPIELSCQWEQHSSLLNEQPWFRDSLTPSELSAALLFDTEFNVFCDTLGHDLPDFDVLWTDPRWAQIGIAAETALRAFS